MKRIIDLMELGLVPDVLIRNGIRRLNRMRLQEPLKKGAIRSNSTDRSIILRFLLPYVLSDNPLISTHH